MLVSAFSLAVAKTFQCLPCSIMFFDASSRLSAYYGVFALSFTCFRVLQALSECYQLSLFIIQTSISLPIIFVYCRVFLLSVNSFCIVYLVSVYYILFFLALFGITT